MNNLEIVIDNLKNTSDKQSQIKILQEINTLLLTQYILKIDDNFILYPIEVEAYYSSVNFKDDTVHDNELQKNRFGKLYFHRKGQSRDNKILFRRSGIDICLSNNDSFIFGVLIRSARINNEEGIINGPQLLAQRVYKHICMDESLEKLSDQNHSTLVAYENESIVLESSINREVQLLIHSSRIGLNKESEYCDINLRSLSDLNISKQKEKDVLEYIKYNNIEPTPDNIRKILGSNSNWIIEQMKSK